MPRRNVRNYRSSEIDFEHEYRQESGWGFNEPREKLPGGIIVPKVYIRGPVELHSPVRSMMPGQPPKTQLRQLDRD